MQETTDGCWEEHEFFGFTEEEQEQMEEWFGDNSWWDLEENGWVQSECEMIIDCEPSIERLEE